jgi:hypothetical protein
MVVIRHPGSIYVHWAPRYTLFIVISPSIREDLVAFCQELHPKSEERQVEREQVPFGRE